MLLPDFKFYEPHPYLGMFPTETDDDLLSVKDSVGKIGVVQRLRVWVDAKGREWLIDGRTRQRAASEVWREMVDAEAVKMRQAGST
ncbi:ParB/Srx family N-terminal domain-containing protein, partial [Escherichia coli]|uniref:ParB/Srx family N-terminal domain-containing protein n=1 Tax=Escherichia coli TaxID=562 RepID=UPI0021D98D2C